MGSMASLSSASSFARADACGNTTASATRVAPLAICTAQQLQQQQKPPSQTRTALSHSTPAGPSQARTALSYRTPTGPSARERVPKLHATTADSVSISMRLHQVAPGETLFSIAASYHLPLDALLAANAKPSPAVRVGEVIFLPLPAKDGDATRFATAPKGNAKGGDWAGRNGAEDRSGEARSNHGERVRSNDGARSAVESASVESGSKRQDVSDVPPAEPPCQARDGYVGSEEPPLSLEDAEIKVSQYVALKLREKPGGNYPQKYAAGPSAGQQRYESDRQASRKTRGEIEREGVLLGGRRESRETVGGDKEGLRSRGLGKAEEARRGRMDGVGGLGRIEEIERCEEREVASAFASVAAPKIPYLDCTSTASSAAPRPSITRHRTSLRQQPQQQPHQLHMQQPRQNERKQKQQQQQRIAGGMVGGSLGESQGRSTFFGSPARQFAATVGQQQQLLLPKKQLSVWAQQSSGRWPVILGLTVAVAAGGVAWGSRGRAIGTTSAQGWLSGHIGGLFGSEGRNGKEGSKQEQGSKKDLDFSKRALRNYLSSKAAASDGTGLAVADLSGSSSYSSSSDSSSIEILSSGGQQATVRLLPQEASQEPFAEVHSVECDADTAGDAAETAVAIRGEDREEPGVHVIGLEAYKSQRIEATGFKAVEDEPQEDKLIGLVIDDAQRHMVEAAHSEMNRKKQPVEVIGRQVIGLQESKGGSSAPGEAALDPEEDGAGRQLWVAEGEGRGEEEEEVGGKEEGSREEGSRGGDRSREVVPEEGLTLERVQNWSVEEARAANALVARKLGLQPL
ncbi:hypothetical protein CLOM_g7232 [Closterium sp. NIES-68]|nr:hypothetical protein CLOM_g7232 [Closterium sp. NIES-68]GJP64403.1 hypothetical protein CLOP_g21400 [Closterium sp. NIES-67]